MHSDTCLLTSFIDCEAMGVFQKNFPFFLKKKDVYSIYFRSIAM